MSCGRAIDFNANVCPYCGYNFSTGAPVGAKHEKGMLSLVGGIFILIAGLMGLFIGGVLLAIDVNDLDQYGFDVSGSLDMLEDILTVCGVIFLVLGLIAVIGGFFGIQRKHFGLVILGGVLGLFVLGPYFLGSLLALAGLILVAVAKKDFD